MLRNPESSFRIISACNKSRVWRQYGTEASAKALLHDPTDGNVSEEYQALPKSSLPTYYFQKSLPRLPVPKLELTAQRYLNSAQCILTPKEFERTQRLVKEFETGIGLSTDNTIIYPFVYLIFIFI